MHIQFTDPDKADYPEQLKKISDPPKMLNYIGSPVWQKRNCISVVGSRAPSIESQAWLDTELSAFVQKIPCAIVSGGARGIDQLAHKIALRNKTPTILFLPSGISNPYPPYLSKWYELIINTGGAIVSHLPPDAYIKKYHFLQRNMWIAGISRATVAIEARRKSGTHRTAQYALDIHRPLGVMSTYPNEAGRGGLDLVCDSGAQLLRDHWDLLLLCNFSELIEAKK